MPRSTGKRAHWNWWVNPMVCECPEPDVDNWGMCQTCKRKPLALMAVARVRG